MWPDYCCNAGTCNGVTVIVTFLVLFWCIWILFWLCILVFTQLHFSYCNQYFSKYKIKFVYKYFSLKFDCHCVKMVAIKALKKSLEVAFYLDFFQVRNIDKRRKLGMLINEYKHGNIIQTLSFWLKYMCFHVITQVISYFFKQVIKYKSNQLLFSDCICNCIQVLLSGCNGNCIQVHFYGQLQ